MANHKSALKRIRQTEKRTLINQNRRSRIRTFIKKVEAAVKAGSKADALAAFKAAEPEIARGVTKGVFHKNKAARTISRLAKHVKALAS